MKISQVSEGLSLLIKTSYPKLLLECTFKAAIINIMYISISHSHLVSAAPTWPKKSIIAVLRQNRHVE